MLDLFCPFYKFHPFHVIPNIIFPSGLGPSYWSSCEWFPFVYSIILITKLIYEIVKPTNESKWKSKHSHGYFSNVPMQMFFYVGKINTQFTLWRKNMKKENIPRKTTVINHAGRTVVAQQGDQRIKAANAILHSNWDMN
jgi:hypothetical protein